VKRPFSAALAVLFAALTSAAQPALDYKIAAPPASGLKSTVAIDIAVTVAGSDTIVWLATGKGVQFSMDNGTTWLQYTSANGLPSDNVSAISPVGGRLWVATNHEGSIGNSLATFSDGVTYTDDGGNNWAQIDFGSSGLNIPFVWGGDRTIYDITGARDTNTYQASGTTGTDWTFFTAFAGAFLSSRDGGINWRRIFPTPGDSIQWNTAGQEPSLRNRYFSCVIDTSHGDSTFVWAGTAGGVFQYVFVQPREKLYSKSFTRVGYCASCGTGTKSLIGGIRGLSLGKISGGQFVSKFLQDGLPGNYISAVREFGGRLFVGTAADSGNSTGLAVSDDDGATFTPVGAINALVSGAGEVISDFADIDSRFYVAAQREGIFVSADTGATWSRLYIDSVNQSSLVNVAHAFDAYGDTLRVGTDSGLAIIAMTPTGDFTNIDHVYFAEDDTTSQRVIRVRTQRFLHDTTGAVDSTAIWTCNIPRSGGDYMVGRIYTDTLGNLQFYRNQVSPTGQGALTYDLGFFDDTVIAVGANGARISPIGGDPNTTFSVIDSVTASVKLDSDTITAIEIRGDTVILASNRALAFSTNRAKKFKVYRPNLDSLSADLVVSHTVINSINTTANRYGLTGDFVPAIARREMGSGIAEMWFSGRPVDAGVPGMAKTWTDTSGKLTLLSMNQTDFAWNFEFNGDTVYAATNAGLLFHVDDSAGDTSQTWDTLLFINQSTSDTLIAPGTSVFAVKKRGSFLWVGTGDGTVRIDLNNMGSQRLFTPVDSSTAKDEVYAFPVPFYPAEGDEVDFHFVVDQAGPVTLEVYDFAMNLVARPIDNVTYAAGIYPNGSTQGRTWDGRNGKGDVVAVGVYYFKVTLPGGDTRWGKLAVLP
jgi:hypothetical protein